MIDISASQINERANCEWRWWFGSVAGYAPIVSPKPPTMGSVLHAAIAADLRHEDGMEVIKEWIGEQRTALLVWEDEAPDAVDEGLEILLEVESQAPGILSDWRKWWVASEFTVPTIILDGKPVLPVEIPLRVDYSTGWRFLFILDAIVKDKDGAYWVWDWKVRGTFLPTEAEEFNVQKALYQWGLMVHGIKVDGSAIAQIYPKTPGIPNINKTNGLVSRQNIRTTWDVYKARVEEVGQDPADYEDMRQKIEGAGWKWFSVSYAPRTEDELNRTVLNVLNPAARRMEAIRNGDEIPIRSLSPSRCAKCWARMACMESLRGASIDDLGSVYGRNDGNEGSDEAADSGDTAGEEEA